MMASEAIVVADSQPGGAKAPPPPPVRRKTWNGPAAALGELLMNFPVAETDGAWYFKGVPQYGMFGQAFKSRTPKAGQKALDTFSALLQQIDALTGGLFVAQSLMEAAFKIAWQETFTKTYAAQGFPTNMEKEEWQAVVFASTRGLRVMHHSWKRLANSGDEQQRSVEETLQE